MSRIQQIHKNIEDTLHGMKIPPRPAILDGILREIRREETDYRKLAGLIAADMSLSASLIKTVNSPFFGIRHKISSIQDALVILGLELAAQMIAGILLHRSFPSHPGLEGIWDHSVKVAVTAHGLIRVWPGGIDLRSEDAYTFGLFRDCGMAMMMLSFDDYGETLNLADADPDVALTDVEIARHAIDHAHVGAHLAREWLMGEDTRNGILHHHLADAETLPPEILSARARRLIAISLLAERVLQVHGLLPTNREWERLGPFCLRALNLPGDEIDWLLPSKLWQPLMNHLREFLF